MAGRHSVCRSSVGGKSCSVSANGGAEHRRHRSCRGVVQNRCGGFAASGLSDRLKSRGRFTVFAPTDEAFAKLPAGTVEDLRKQENKENIRAIRLYHVVPGDVIAKDAVKLTSAKTVEGQSLMVRGADGKVIVENATVEKPDVMAPYGIIRVIDTVPLPR